MNYRKPVSPYFLALLIATLATGDLFAGTGEGDGDHDDERVVLRIPQQVRWVCKGEDGKAIENCVGALGRRGYLGVRVQTLSSELRRHFGAPEEAGVLVAQVSEDSPAARADLAVGDVITAVDGQAVASPGELTRLVRAKEAGDVVDLELFRDGRRITTRAEVEGRALPGLDLSGLMVDLDKLELDRLLTLDGLDFQVLDLRALDFEGFAAEIDGEAIEEALASARKALADVDWQAYARRLEEVDLEALEERMKQVQERLEELEVRVEKEIEELERDDDF